MKLNSKNESVIFFGKHVEKLYYKTVARRLNNFKMKHYKFKLDLQRKLQKSNGGTGKNNIKFPNSFELKDIKSLEQCSCNICEKFILVNDYDSHMKENHEQETTKAFIKECRLQVEECTEYFN